MEFEIGRKIILRGMKSETRQAIKHRLTMPNPKYEEAEKRGRWTGNLEPKLRFYEETDRGLICPRGATGQLVRLCERHEEKCWLIDRLRFLPPVEFTFYGSLRDFQKPAVEACLKKPFALLSAPTGSGKTTMGLYMIAQRQQPTLVVVHTKELLNQWRNRIKQFLGIEAGVIGGGYFKTNPVTVATVQTLVKHAENIAPHFGYLILDECHRAPAMQYVRAVEVFDCKYMTGLSATPYRRDGLSKVIFWHIGDVAGKIDKAELVDTGEICPADVVWIETDFNTWTDATQFYSKALSELAEDQARNQMICRTVAENNGHGISLILSDRKAHCGTLAAILEAQHGIKAEVLTGGTGTKDRERILEDLHQGRCRSLIATGQLIGEGFDLPAISSMFLTTPVKYHGRLIQYIGRALRPAPGKNKAVIYDFVDVCNLVFAASAKARAYTYEQQGVKAVHSGDFMGVSCTGQKGAYKKLHDTLMS
ncbi:MAG: DEAD/DEAH box helicase [Desulfobacteraceae bacterium]|nr:DEAD/DEAH box helicase [Desulfobacteraceae bacterium]